MADDYVIKARIVVDDSQAKAGTTGVIRQIDQVEARAKTAGMSISGIFGKAFLAAGGLFGLQKLGSGIVGVQTEIQNAEGALATLSSALFKMPIEESIGVARQMVRGLNEDAAKGVGELGDYTKAFQMLLAPTSAAGANLEQIRAFTKQSLTAGFAMRGTAGLEQAPLDIVQALQAGVNERMTPIAARVVEAAGESAAAFNKMDTAEKMKVLSKGFALFEDGAKLLGQGWDAQTATLKDQLKGIARTLTAPLFDRWTEGLRNVNAWLEKNRDWVIEIAENAGTKLLALWDELIGKAGRYAAILAGAAVAQHLPPSLGAPGRSRAGAMGGGGILAELSKGAYTPAVSAGADLFGKRGGVVKGAQFSAMAPLSNLLKLLGRVAGPAAILATAFVAIQGALSEFPSLLEGLRADAAALFSSLEMVGAAFAGLTEQGSLLNIVGWALVRPFVGLGTALSFVFRGVALVVEVFNLLSTVLGTMTQQAFGTLQMLAALATGNMELGRAGADRHRAGAQARAEQTDAISKRIATILGMGPGKVPGAGEEGEGDVTPGKNGALPDVSAAGTNINIGKVSVDARSTINDDPARVALAWETVLDEVNRNPRQPKRQASPLIG